jgi:hypothetical protein
LLVSLEEEEEEEEEEARRDRDRSDLSFTRQILCPNELARLFSQSAPLFPSQVPLS